ncbi:MAG TPA: hypothetical protein VHN99_07265 [Deinococcales bacterium]|nr:hypothetical protein [Deinococcales bacterium]
MAKYVKNAAGLVSSVNDEDLTAHLATGLQEATEAEWKAQLKGDAKASATDKPQE